MYSKIIVFAIICEEFHNQTTPVLEYYYSKVTTINADDDLENITESIRHALD
jgi:adenylate kinase family enzyme